MKSTTAYPARPTKSCKMPLIGLHDRYCARVSARNHRRSIVPDQALQHISSTRACPSTLLREQFVKLGKYPPGNLWCAPVRSGELGVVTQRAAHVHPLSDPLARRYAATLAQLTPRDTRARQ
jgi:hypothetical protein